MAASPAQFARLLTDAVYHIRLRENRPIGIIQDELGFALGRQGGSAIEYWRKGNVPHDAADVAALARHIITRSTLDQTWLEAFLRSAAYPEPEALRTELFTPAGADRLPHNLPPQVTPFIGRDAERRQVIVQLGDPTCHLLTVLGPGGIGKTRLSIEVGRALAAEPPASPTLPDGVYFVPLVTASTPGEITEAIANSLQLTFRSQAAPADQIREHLASRSVLLILDNFDHLVEHVALLTDLVQNAPGVKLLVTSRERLNIHGEWVFPLQGLPVVTRNGPRDADALALFAAAARRQQPDFAITPQSLPAAREICRLVDGLPLALELAAAWTRVLPVEDIATEIGRTTDFLSTTQRDLPRRHRSLRAVCESSWQRLSEREQAVFRRLAVFRGGFDRPAAREVAGADLEVLSALVDKSLVRVVRDEQPARYDLHEMLRQYATEQLQADVAADETVRARHAETYTGRLHTLVPSLRTISLRALLPAVTADLENIRAAWQWAAAHERDELILRAQDALWLYYEMRGRIHDGAALFATAVSGLLQNGVPHATAQARQAWFLTRLGRHAAAETLLQESVAAIQKAGADEHLPFALLMSAVNSYTRGDYGGAAGALQACFQHSTATGDRFHLAVTRAVMGNVARTAGDFDTAQQLLEEAAAVLQDVDNILGMALIRNTLGGIAFERHAYASAAEHYHAGLDLCRTIDYDLGVAMNEAELGRALLAQGDHEAAGRHLRAALRTALEMQAIPTALRVSVGLAELLVEEEQCDAVPDVLQLTAFHPASDRKTKDRALELLEALGRTPEEEGKDGAISPSDQLTTRFVHYARRLLDDV